VIPVTIEPFSALGVSTIDASVFGKVNGTPVSDNSLSPNPLPTWTVQSAAMVSYEAGSLFESTVSRGQLQSLSVVLRNDGEATVTLDTAFTTISFTDGSNNYLAQLEQTEALPGNSSQIVDFKAATVPAGFTPGSYDVDLHLEGLENGGSFSADINTFDVGDQITVVTPASLGYQGGSLDPTVVNKGTTAFFEVTVSNSGGATVELIADSTRFFFDGGAYDADLDDNVTSTVAGNDSTTLRFTNQLVSTAIAAASYFPTVRVVGTENGLPFSSNIPLSDAVDVQDAADISIVSITPSQNPITADQSIGINLAMIVTNSGGSAVALDSARVRFIEGGTDRTSQFAIVNPTAFDFSGAVLPGGQTDSLIFAVSDNTANSMTAGNFTIEGNLWVEDQVSTLKDSADTDLGGKGSLLVQTPGELDILSIVPTKNPVTVSRNMPFQIKMAVQNNGQSDVQVTLDADSTLLQFLLGSGWGWTVQSTLAGGGTVVGGGEIDRYRWRNPRRGTQQRTV
jgi:hypothetical protein